MDNSGNVNESVQSETFTIDKTAPIINVDINNAIIRFITMPKTER